MDKIRVEVRKAQAARNLSDEQTMQLFQQNFEHSLDQLIGAIRSSFNVRASGGGGGGSGWGPEWGPE